MQPKLYVKLFLSLFGLLLLLASGYIYYFYKHYPIPITNRISFDAKLKFIREHIDPDKVDTIIVGSSIGMNNILGSVLQKNSKEVRYALNLSVYEATALEAEQILELSDAFPNLKRILYSVQYSDLPHPYTYKDYDPETLKKYIRHDLSPLAFLKLVFQACNNLPFCYERAKKWEQEHMQPDQFTSLIFDKSGSVPLEIYRKEKVGGRWHIPHPGVMHPKSFQAIARMIEKAKKKGICFYVVHQPYRTPLYEKHAPVRGALEYFDKHIRAIIKNEKWGALIRIQPLFMDDSHFADRTHLNIKGSTKVSKYVAQKIDTIEKEKPCSLQERK